RTDLHATSTGGSAMNRTIVRLLALALLALPTALIAGPPDDAKVTAVSLSHQGNSARLSIAVQGEVSVRDFMLSDPARLVLDLRGATLQDVADVYDGLRRGAVRDVRVRQHEVNVVRVVLEFDRVPGYEVIRDGDGNVVVSYVDAPFSPWGSTQQLVAAPLQPQSQAIPARQYASRPTLDNVRMGSGTGNSFRTVDDDPITVTFNGASIQEVAATFARYSGRDIIVGPNVDVSVDAIITNQPWANAFNGILTTYGLSVA